MTVELDIEEIKLLRKATHKAIMSNNYTDHAEFVKLAKKLDKLMGVEDGE